MYSPPPDDVDLIRGDLLDPQQRMQRRREGLFAADVEEQHRVALFGRTPRHQLARLGVDEPQTPGLQQAGHIQDHGDTPVPQNGRPRKDPAGLQRFVQGLDHDLLGIDDGVHQQAKLMGAQPDDDDEDAVVRRSAALMGALAALVVALWVEISPIRPLSSPVGPELVLGRVDVGLVDPQHLGEPEDGEQLIPQPVDFPVVHELQVLVHVNPMEPHDLVDIDLGDGVAQSLHRDDQGRHDGQGQGQLDGDRRASIHRRGDIDDAPETLEGRQHHVHAHATAGDVRDLGRHGESGLEHKFVGFPVAERGRLFGRDQSPLKRSATQGLGVHPATIVGDLDVDLPRTMEGPQPDPALALLALGLAVFGGLDPMIDGVAYQVGQGIVDRLDDVLVQLDLGALDLDADLLAQLGGQIPHHAPELGEHVPHRAHTRLHDGVLQPRGHHIEPLGNRDDLIPVLVLHRLAVLVAHQHQLGGQVHQLVQQGQGDADRGPWPGCRCGHRRWIRDRHGGDFGCDRR